MEFASSSAEPAVQDAPHSPLPYTTPAESAQQEISTLSDAVYRTLWHQGCVHPNDIRHVVTDMGCSPDQYDAVVESTLALLSRSRTEVRSALHQFTWDNADGSVTLTPLVPSPETLLTSTAHFSQSGSVPNYDFDDVDDEEGLIESGVLTPEAEKQLLRLRESAVEQCLNNENDGKITIMSVSRSVGFAVRKVSGTVPDSVAQKLRSEVIVALVSNGIVITAVNGRYVMRDGDVAFIFDNPKRPPEIFTSVLEDFELTTNEPHFVDLFEPSDDTPSIETLRSHGVDPTAPTPAKPGSEEKVRVITARYAAGLPLWHSDDWTAPIILPKT